MKLKKLYEDINDLLGLTGSHHIANKQYATGGSSKRAESGDKWSGDNLNKSSGNPSLTASSPVSGPYLQPATLDKKPRKFEFMTGKEYPDADEDNDKGPKDQAAKDAYNVYDPRQEPHRNVAKSKSNKKGAKPYVGYD